MVRARTYRATAIRAQGGFTLIEMVVVIAILILFAAVIEPNVVARRISEQHRAFFSELGALARQARETAISERKTAVLQMDSSGHRFVLSVQEDTMNTENASRQNITADASGEGELREERHVDVPDGIDISNSTTDGESSGSDWNLEFYPDGTAQSGGVEITDAGRVQSLQVKADGTVTIVEGQLPDQQDDRWQAGDYEHRQ